MDNKTYKYDGIKSGHYGVKSMGPNNPDYRQYIGLPNIKALIKKYTADCCESGGNPFASCDLNDLHYYQPSGLTLQFAGVIGIFIILVGTMDVFDIISGESCTIETAFLGYLGATQDEFIMVPNSIAQSYGFPAYFSGAQILEGYLRADAEGIAGYVITCGPVVCRENCIRSGEINEVNASTLTATSIGNDYYLLSGQLDVDGIGLVDALFVVYEINGLLFIQSQEIGQSLGYDGLVGGQPVISGVLAITSGSLASGSVDIIGAPEFFFNLTQLKTCGTPVPQ